MTIEEMCKEAYDISASKGFHEEDHDPTVRLMLVVCELAEAVEEIRKGYEMNHTYSGADGKPEGIPIEIADAFIRLGDFCAEYDIEIAPSIRLKMDFNKTRTYKHSRTF